MKKLLSGILISLMCVSFVACANKTVFPVDNGGYPKNDVVLINGEEYFINGSYNTDQEIIPEPTVIEIKRQEKIKIIVADHDFYPSDWCIEETEGITATTYTSSYSENKSDDMPDGASSGLRIFEITAEKDAKEIILMHKSYSLNEENKQTEDVLCVYQQVIIKLS
ncbi:MAG: hypothetical protein IIW16_03320 [Clostridia bacterium]|nr:hypothetical protein [Clostridia bacterium]